MAYQRLKIILAALFISILCGCASKSLDDNDPYLGMREDVLYKKGMAALDRGYYKEAISVFESYESQFPLSPGAERVLMKYAYAQYMTGEHALAVASADRFLKLYPRSSYADYVLYIKGIANTDHSRNELDRYFPVDIALRDSTYLKMAYQDFSRLTQLYPRSKYAGDARQRMILIRNTLAKKELSIVSYYFDREDFVAASNRAMYLIEHYPQSPDVEHALNFYIKSQQALGFAESRRDAIRILQTNYPNSPFLKRLG